MPSNIAALAYMLIGIGSAWLTASLSFPAYSGLLIRIAAAWSGISVLMILTPSAAVFFLATGLILVVAAPRAPTERFCYFFAMFPAMPLFAMWGVPFPGINYLILLDYPKLLIITVLLPLLFMERSQDAMESTDSHRRIVMLTCCYLGLGAILDFRSTSLTNGMREAVDYVIEYGVPVLVIARVGLVRGIAENAVFGLLLGGVFTFFIGFMQFLSDWYFYLEMVGDLVRRPQSYEMIFDYRGGRRIPSTMEIIPFGIYMSLCVGIAYAYRPKLGASKLSRLLAPMFVFGVMLSGSRAAQISIVAIAAILFLYSERAKKFRKLLVVMTSVVALAGLLAFQAIDRITALDPYGTFQYRIDLIFNAADVVADYPVFGTPDYRSHPSMERSRQGQGIIDVVNAYLSVVLRHGILGLFLFVAPLWLAIKRVLEYRKGLELGGGTEEEYFARLVAAVMIAFAVALATVSMVDRLSNYYWMLIALAAIVGARTASVSTSPSTAEAGATKTDKRGLGVHDYAR